MTRTMMRWAVAPLAVLALAACGDREAETPAGAPAATDETLAQIVDGGDLSTLDGVIEKAGLGTVLEGVGPYTVLAPVNAAFTGDVAEQADAAAAAAMIRAHILPGAVTRADIAKALDADADGKVEMRTMDDGLVTFSRDGTTIVATGPGGATARLTGEETAATNGVAQPIDGLLVAPAA
ncbi:fasciclin domain-containing protein [Brevundimonas sp.]